MTLCRQQSRTAHDSILCVKGVHYEQGKKNHEYNNQLMVLKGYLDKPDRLKDYLELIILIDIVYILNIKRLIILKIFYLKLLIIIKIIII